MQEPQGWEDRENAPGRPWENAPVRSPLEGGKLLRVKPGLLPIAALFAMAVQASGQGVPRPAVPDELKAPAGEQIVLLAHATGSQIYVCQAGTDGKLAWALKAPDADLHDQQGRVIGRHFAGPRWKDNDGSEVSGKAVAKVDSPDPDSIPWLLVTATGHSGEGVLSHVTSIQRIHTKGGVAPPAEKCDPSKPSAETWIPYSADYYFFAPGR
jgi:Protein of unknown function (DUF3455)